MLEEFKKHQGLMADFAKTFIVPMKEAEDRGSKFEPEGYDDFYKIFHGFTDICETIETIDLLHTLIEINPPRSKRVSIDLYFKHVVSSYLAEVYILKERLNAYATKISRMYSKSKGSPFVKSDFDPLFSKIKESLGGINNTRNLHVHSQRYTDGDLNWLSSLKLVCDHDDSFKEGLKKQHKLLKRKWSKLISDNNQTMVNLLTEYFDNIINLISINGEIVLPDKRIN